MTGPTFNPNFGHIASVNAKPESWTWNDVDRARWREASPRWQQFANLWRNADEQVFRPQLLNLSAPDTANLCGHVIFVRDCYRMAEDVVWTEAEAENGRTGVIFTGQPGIGKTLFLWYLLVRLLWLKQVVLFYDGSELLLFYHDNVYSASKVVEASSLPADSTADASVFIWSIFDLPKEDTPPAITTEPSICFPVQAPFPNENQYHNWCKARSSLYTGFPLWTVRELSVAAKVTPGFQKFWAYLENAVKYWRDDIKWGNSHKDVGFHSTVLLLRRVYDEKDVPTLVNEEDASGSEEDVPGSEDEKDAPKSAEEAFSTLLDVLFSYFGPIPRDIFSAMRNFDKQWTLHQGALQITFNGLEELCRQVDRSNTFPITGALHRLVSIHLKGEIGDPLNTWSVDFKSTHIAKLVTQRLWEENDKEVHSWVRHFSSTSSAKSFAGSLFEPIVHRDMVLGPGGDNTRAWPLLEMRLEKPKKSKTPHFVLEDDTTTGSFPVVKRTKVKFNPNNLPQYFTEDTYYVPDSKIFLLFDSFIVQLDYNAKHASADLWLLQITTADIHRGSTKGYQVVRQIINITRKQLKAHGPPPAKKAKGPTKGPPVRVHYVLVRPAGAREPGVRWVLPEGWYDNTKRIDHKGNGYLLEIPFSPLPE